MTPIALRAVTRAGAHPHARAARLQIRLRRFSPRVIAPVRALAQRHPALADLAVSFPALLFALAVPRRGLDCEALISGVIDGAKLKALARQAAIPMWLRMLPPEAFAEPLPLLPDGDVFRLQIANYFPRSPKAAAKWLRAVACASDCGDDVLALWAARQVREKARNVDIERLPLISLWAWYSTAGAAPHWLTPAAVFDPAMTFSAAEDAADRWKEKVELHVSLGMNAVADVWFTPRHVNGYDFVPLATAQAIAEEAAAMRNCLNTYGGYVAHGHSRLWSIRKDGARVATLDIRCGNGDPVPNVSQLRSSDNSDATVELSAVVRSWIAGQESIVPPKPVGWRKAPLDRAAWVGLWRPYWLAKRRIPAWLPLSPCRRALDRL